MYRNIYIFFAWICVGAAFLGIFLPLLPTTPFLLLAVYLYMRSSKSGIKMILRNRYLAPYVRSYFAREGIPGPILKRTLVTLWCSMAICIAIFHGRLPVQIMLFAIAAGVSIHLYCRRNGRKPARKENGRQKIRRKDLPHS